MIIYEFYCRDVLLGHLYIQNKQHRYIPIPENVGEMEKKYPLDRVMIHGYEWGKPIPFFQERIENATRFGKEKLIRYQTDEFLMRMIEESND